MSSEWAFAAKPSGCDALILTPYIQTDDVCLARELSEVDPENFVGIKSHSGFITVKEEYNSNLFFWYFPHEKAEEVPWIIWLQGGPGWSSLQGLFDINGPIHIEDGKAAHRNITWASDYSMLFVDSPAGSGFSYTDDSRGYAENEDDVGEQLYVFLLQFLKIFPELRRAPLFIAGESYGGKYVSALGIQLHRNRNNLEDDEEPINFKGISMGSSMIEPRTMIHYSEMCGVMGLVEGNDLDTLKQLEEAAVALVDEEKMVDAANKGFEALELIRNVSGVNIFNFNQDPAADDHPFRAFVTSPEVRCSIHVGNASYDPENLQVRAKMLPDIMNTTKPFVEELLEYYGVLVYSGQLDLVLPYSTSRRLYKVLRWSRRDQYDLAPRIRLRKRNSQNDAVVAYRKSGGNLVEVLIREAGHMAPKDQPEATKLILDDFINEFK